MGSDGPCGGAVQARLFRLMWVEGADPAGSSGVGGSIASIGDSVVHAIGLHRSSPMA